MDLFGPVAYLSISGNKYGLVIVDDYTRFTLVFFVFDKSQVQEKVKIFIWIAQREFGFPIKKVHSDNGTKFKNAYVVVTMEPNSRTPMWKNFLMKGASSMSFQLHTPLNKMV
jgi:hypothetical protein